MVLAVEWGTGQVVWSLFWLSLFVMWIALAIRVVWNVLHSSKLSGVAKALWVAAVVFFPFLGVFGYLILSGDLDDPERDARVDDVLTSSAYLPMV